MLVPPIPADRDLAGAHPTGNAFNWLAKRQVGNAIAVAASRYARGRLIDIGCGEKPYAGVFAPYVGEHVGVDYGGGPHQMANVDVVATAYDVPLPDDSFDTALLSEVLEHLEEPADALREAWRLLRPGGHLIVTVPFVWVVHEEPRDFYRYSPFGLRYLLEKAGFEVEAITPVGGQWSTLALMAGYAMRQTGMPGAEGLADGLQQAAVELDRTRWADWMAWNHLGVARKPGSAPPVERVAAGAGVPSAPPIEEPAALAPRVLVWRNELGVRSESWISDQAGAMRRWRPEYGTQTLELNALGLEPSVLTAALDANELLARVSEYELVHAHFLWDGVAIAPVAHAVGLPLVVTSHGYDAAEQSSLARRAELAPLFAQAAKVVAVSGFIAERLVELGAPPEKVVVHHIGIPLPEDAPDAQERSGILFAGRLVEKKACGDLLAAVRSEPALYGVPVHVVGDGPLRAELERQAEGLDVTFHGWTAPETVHRMMREAAVLCGPSKRASNGDSEGLPITILEAMARRLPVVATTAAGIPEAVVDGETGVLVPEGDHGALAAALVRVLGDAPLRAALAEAGRRRVEERFDVVRQSALLEDLYAEVCWGLPAMPAAEPVASEPAPAAPSDAPVGPSDPLATVSIDEEAEYYDEYVERQLRVGVNDRHRAIADGMRRAGWKAGDRVLEIGAGVGTLTELIAEGLQGGSLVATDLSPRSIDVARIRLRRFAGVELLAGDVLDVEIRGPFDVIVLPDVIEHIPLDLHGRLFERIGREWLAPGGLVYLNYPNPHYIAWMHEHRRDLLQVIDQPVHVDPLAGHVQRAGMYVHQLETYSIWIPEGDYVKAVLRRSDDARAFTVPG
jgi:glycosyltransferase involved in cell wall biosynthesis/2-polyprenyl-3-methyl-5-hydroxy-6-metoxy-1,4-benzoquinol methylase